jgi:hemolysin III
VTHPSHRSSRTEPKFSPWLFLLTIATTLAGLCGLIAWTLPEWWQVQVSAPWWSLLGVFVVAHGIAAVVEFFFHRYLLHAPLVPFLSYFYKQHTLHHALTRVGYRRAGADGASLPLLVENRYPIEEKKQHEASYFPWYALLVFTLIAGVLIVPVQWMLPQVPVVLGSVLAVAFSVTLYELLHAAEHLPVSFWNRLLARRRSGRFWRKVYAFHLRHHADVRCNEAVSGFFGLPVADWVFGTYVDPETLYRHGSTADASQFASPRPRFGLIRWLDRKAAARIAHRRRVAS